MKTLLVWVLMTSGGYGGNQIVYSPPVADSASCQRMQAYAGASMRANCVQIMIYVPDTTK